MNKMACQVKRGRPVACCSRPPSRTSILPVTAAEIRAVRSSLRRPIASRTLATRASIRANFRSRNAAIERCSSMGGRGVIRSRKASGYRRSLDCQIPFELRTPRREAESGKRSRSNAEQDCRSRSGTRCRRDLPSRVPCNSTGPHPSPHRVDREFAAPADLVLFVRFCLEHRDVWPLGAACHARYVRNRQQFLFAEF